MDASPADYILLFDENQPGQTRILKSYALGLLVFSFLRCRKKSCFWKPQLGDFLTFLEVVILVVVA
jgi:hypothetical protein